MRTALRRGLCFCLPVSGIGRRAAPAAHRLPDAAHRPHPRRPPAGRGHRRRGEGGQGTQRGLQDSSSARRAWRGSTSAGRSIGYVVLAAKPQDITAVIAFPVTGEKEFLGLCDRVNKDKLKVDAKDKTLYHMPPLEPQYKALMRFKDRYAYIAYGANPAPHIESAALVPMEKLYDPAERGLIAARLHVERIPLPVLLAAKSWIDEVKKQFAGQGIGQQEEAILKPAMAELEKLATRYIKYAGGHRHRSPLVSCSMRQPATSSSRRRSPASRTPNSPRPSPPSSTRPIAFAALACASRHRRRAHLPAAALRARTPQRRGARLGGCSEGSPRTPTIPARRPREELFKGLARTAKTGEFDLTLAVRGPDKDGWFTVLGAVAFDDTAALEKAYRDYIDKNPDKAGGETKWDVGQGGYRLHSHPQTQPGRVHRPEQGLRRREVHRSHSPSRRRAVFLAMGPDAIGTLKEALAVKPAPAPVLDVLLNPARTTKLIQKIMGPDDPDIADVEIVLGKEDKLLSILSATLEGGKELRAAITINLKVLPALRFIARSSAPRRKRAIVPPKPVEK